MFEARQSKRFIRRMEILKANLAVTGEELTTLNSELKTYSEVLSKSLEKSEGRKETRLLAESDKCDDLLDKVDDLAMSIGVEFTPDLVDTVDVDIGLPPYTDSNVDGNSITPR